MKLITKRLRILRTEREITQRETAISAGLPHYRYMEIENGYRIPTPTELRRIARTLKTTPAAILAESDSKAVAS
jgi:transcriptional regulator with XRE-family HTH domain